VATTPAPKPTGDLGKPPSDRVKSHVLGFGGRPLRHGHRLLSIRNSWFASRCPESPGAADGIPTLIALHTEPPIVRPLILALALLATQATGETCKAGQRKLHGKCVAARPPAAPVRSVVRPLPTLVPAPPPTRTATAFPATPTIHAATLNGVFRLSKNASNVAIGPVWVDGPYRAVESAPNVRTTGLTIRGLKATNLQRDAIRILGASNVLIERFDVSMRAAPQTGSNLPEGIAIGGNNCTPIHNVTIRDGKINGFRMASVEGKYTNGDGIASEGCVDGLTIERVTSSNNSDGAFDLKGTRIVLRDLVAVNSNRAFRIWGKGVVATTLTADQFRGAGIWLGKDASITVDHFIGRSAKPGIVFRWESGASLTVKSCDLTGMAPGSTLQKSDGAAAKVLLGRGCKL
jgi:hypothetical protein